MGKLQSNNCMVKVYGLGYRAGARIGLEAPVQHLEHLELDAGEQCRVDVENFLQCVLELPGVR